MATVKERLLNRIEVDDTTGCWIWQGHLDRYGYGTICIGSRTDGSRRTRSTHRVAYEEWRGPINGETLDHIRCDRPACVNPWHMEPADRVANAMRGRTGELARAAERRDLTRRRRAVAALTRRARYRARYREALRLRSLGWAWAAIAVELGYTHESSAIYAARKAGTVRRFYAERLGATAALRAARGQ